MTIEAKYCFDKVEARVYFITLVLWSVHIPILNVYLNLLSVSVSETVLNLLSVSETVSVLTSFGSLCPTTFL